MCVRTCPAMSHVMSCKGVQECAGVMSYHVMAHHVYMCITQELCSCMYAMSRHVSQHVADLCMTCACTSSVCEVRTYMCMSCRVMCHMSDVVVPLCVSCLARDVCTCYVYAVCVAFTCIWMSDVVS